MDRDVVEARNLHRVALFDEDHLARRLPKAIAAAERLRQINSQVEIEPVVAEVDFRNVERLCEEVETISESAYGTKYVIDGELATPAGGLARIRTVWIVEREGMQPQLVTAYPT